jgi:hypothetical protein
VLPARAELCLLRALAGVELGGLRRGLVRVGIELLARQPQRVVGRLGLRAGQQQHAVLRAAPAQARRAQRTRGSAVGAEAFDVQVRGAGLHVPDATQWGGDGSAHLPQAESAGIQRTLGAAAAGWLGEGGNDATGAVAVQHRERPAQHLDARCPGQVEVPHLTLPVGHAGGDAVGVEA